MIQLSFLADLRKQRVIYFLLESMNQLCKTFFEGLIHFMWLDKYLTKIFANLHFYTFIIT